MALVWQAQFARVAHAVVRWPDVFVLAVSTWLAYAADRWFEGWRLAPNRIQTQRHHFYQRWRWPIFAVWVALFTADVGIALSCLSERKIVAGFILLGPILLYLLSHQLVHRDRAWRAPKEICVAVLIAGGAVVFVSAEPGALWSTLAAPLVLFGFACFTNCALISGWEHEVDAVHGQQSLARQYGRGHPLLRALPWVLAGSAVLYAWRCEPAARDAAWALGASALLLGAIDFAEPRLGRQLARVLADAALLTPLATGLAR